MGQVNQQVLIHLGNEDCDIDSSGREETFSIQIFVSFVGPPKKTFHFQWLEKALRRPLPARQLYLSEARRYILERADGVRRTSSGENKDRIMAGSRQQTTTGLPWERKD